MRKTATIEPNIFDGFAKAMKDRYKKERFGEYYDPSDPLNDYRSEGINNATMTPSAAKGR